MLLWVIFLAEVIFRFTEACAKLVKPGGYFIAAGIIQTKKGSSKRINGISQGLK